ncbi:MAG: ABC-2 type transport system permease protein [Rhodothermales bacterium]|jgi:ABC-2 type transport system permease protein
MSASRPMIQLSGSLQLTFRELWSTYVTLGLFVVSTICWLFLTFAMNLDVVEGSVAALRIFGFESTPTNAIQNPETGEWVSEGLGLDQFVIGIQSFVIGAAYFLGTLLGIFAAAPLTASLVTESRIGLLLSKPLSRNRFLAGHVLGVFATVLLLSTYLVLAVWLVLSFKTGIWIPSFLLAIPIITLMFGVMYGVVLLVIVLTGSSGFALVTAYGLIFLSFILAAHEQIVTQLVSPGKEIFLAFYYLLPNFIEVVPFAVQLVEGDPVNTWVPITSSIVFGAIAYFGAFQWFSRKDF